MVLYYVIYKQIRVSIIYICFMFDLQSQVNIKSVHEIDIHDFLEQAKKNNDYYVQGQP